MYKSGNEKIEAFPKNFRMLAGDPYRRTYTLGNYTESDPPKSEWQSTGQSVETALRQRALGFNCLHYNRGDEASLSRHYLPNKDNTNNKTSVDECSSGVRFELMFPSCWNGKDPDSPDHKSHMAYPSTISGGGCPQGYGKRLPTLFYEVIFNTQKYIGQNGQFVISTGDPTGFSYHGDFIQGWQDGYLQSAIDDETCGSSAGSGEVEACPVFTENNGLQDDGPMNQCHFQMPDELKNENVQMHTPGLPGLVKIIGEGGNAYPVQLTNGQTVGSDITAGDSVAGGGSASSADSSSSSDSPSPSSSAKAGQFLQNAGAVDSSSAVSTEAPTSASSGTTVTSQEVVYVEQQMIVSQDAAGQPVATQTGALTTFTTETQAVTNAIGASATQLAKRDELHHNHHARRHGHHHY